MLKYVRVGWRYMKNPLENNEYEKRNRKSRVDFKDPRGPFFHDQTKIVHSMPFRRLKKKTQVFFSPENDHICTRIEHVIHVATIATTICKGLKNQNNEQWGFLNENMAYAIGLGHDLGHAPFGHEGEKTISEILKTKFYHEIQGYRVTQHVYDLNLTYGVKDGIISHNGEKFDTKLKPSGPKKDLNKIKKIKKLIPATYEGCIVRFSDKIAYLSRDWEDAIKLHLVKRNDLPNKIKKTLSYFKGGKINNASIINNLVLDLINNSKDSEYVSFSKDVNTAFHLLKEYNYDKIYYNSKLDDYKSYVHKIIKGLYNHLNQLYGNFGTNYSKYKNEKILDSSFGNFMKVREKLYKKEEAAIEEIIIDYISGMTDDFALKCMKEISIPEPLPYRFEKKLITK